MKKVILVNSLLLVVSVFCLSLNSNAQCPVSSSCSPGTAVNAGLGFSGGIFRVRIGTINYPSFGDSEGYLDRSCLDSTDLYVGQADSVNLITGGTLNERVKIWVDLDNNSILDDVNELVYTSNSALKFHAGTFVIPNGTVLDTPLRMRISSDWDASAVPTPCSTPEYGQVEDYMVRVKPNPNPPVAAFSVSDTVTCSGDVDFFDESTNLPTEWKWFFGDGDSSQAQNPSHTYLNSGTFTVTLIATNNNGSHSEIKTNHVTYNSNAPVAASCFPTTSSFCCNYGILKVNLGTINNSSPNASEGNVDFSCSSSATLMEGINYTLSMETNTTLAQDFNIYLDMDNDGAFDESTELIKTIRGKINPSDNFKIPAGAILNTSLRLRICADHEGSTITACGALANGQSEDYSITVTENTNPPVANFSTDETTRCDSVFSFTNSSENTITSVLWDFGDGETSTDFEPIHNYTDEGVYTVSLTVTNSYGSDVLTRETYITRNIKPKDACTVSSGGPNWVSAGVKNVNIADAGLFNNTSADDDKSYKDYSCEYTAEFNSGDTYQFIVYTGSEDAEQVKIFIDWNDDGELDEFTELVMNETAYVNHDTYFTIPTDASVARNKRLRMRVMAAIVDQGNFIGGPCDDVFWGEIEDYSVIVDKVEGIEELSLGNVEVYPNPSNGNFAIKSAISLDDVSIYNTLGKLVYQENVAKSRSAQGKELSIQANLNKGVYFVRLNAGDRRTTVKLVVQ